MRLWIDIFICFATYVICRNNNIPTTTYRCRCSTGLLLDDDWFCDYFCHDSCHLFYLIRYLNLKIVKYKLQKKKKKDIVKVGLHIMLTQCILSYIFIIWFVYKVVLLGILKLIGKFLDTSNFPFNLSPLGYYLVCSL